MRFRLAVLFLLPAALFSQNPPAKTFQEEYNAWFRMHPLPPANASPEQRAIFQQQVAQASAEWVKHWPDNPHALLQRFKSLSRVKSTPNQELEEVGETVVSGSPCAPRRELTASVRPDTNRLTYPRPKRRRFQ